MEISLTAFVPPFQPRDVLRYLNCALSLHLHGVTDIETSAQAAGALGPLAGKFAQTLFALGIISRSARFPDPDLLRGLCPGGNV